jgi:hypothetical protein
MSLGCFGEVLTSLTSDEKMQDEGLLLIFLLDIQEVMDAKL